MSYGRTAVNQGKAMVNLIDPGVGKPAQPLNM